MALKSILSIAVCFAALAFAGIPQGELYPQPVHPTPKPQVGFVAPKFGAAATWGTAPGLDSLTPSTTGYVYITGGLNTLPANFQERYTTNYAGFAVSKDLEVLNVDTKEWEYRRTWTRMPKSRAFHIQQYHNGNLYVYGGGATGLDRYSIAMNRWESVLASGTVPEPTFAAAATVLGDTLYYFGGARANGQATGRFFAYDIDSISWSELTEGPQLAGATLVGDSVSGKLFLFGGTNQQGSASEILYVFDTATLSWSEIGPRAAHGRFGHVAFVHEPSRKLYISLGLRARDPNDWYTWDIDTEEWNRIILGDESVTPAHKFGFAQTYIPTLHEHWVIGGASNTSSARKWDLHGDVWGINIEDGISGAPITHEWTRHFCFPGFKFAFPQCVLAQEEEPCDACENCYDYSVVTRTYVRDIQHKLITKQFQGYLRQCPAFWKLAGLDNPSK